MEMRGGTVVEEDIAPVLDDVLSVSFARGNTRHSVGIREPVCQLQKASLSVWLL